MEKSGSVCDEDNYKMIYDAHAETIRNFIYYKCGDLQQAEDVTQEAFVRLWTKCKDVILGKAKSFVMKVAQNLFYNEANHKKVVLKYNKRAVAQLYGERPDFLMEENEFFEKLTKGIANLPEKQREVFLLSRKDKKTYREIAEIIGITQKAVERRMHLALLELREKVYTNI